jgi:hypothetical protein
LFPTLVIDVHHFPISKDQERKNEMLTLTMVMMMIMMMKKNTINNYQSTKTQQQIYLKDAQKQTPRDLKPLCQ